MPLSLLSLTLTQPTKQVPTGSVRLVVDLGSAYGPLTIDVPGLTQGVEAMAAPSPNHAYAYEATGIAPGTYPYTVYDAGPPPKAANLTGSFTLNPVPVVNGCTDPDADNFDPNATDNDGSCVVSQRLGLVGALPDLAPLGVPLLVALASATVANAVPTPATVTFNLANLGAATGVQLRLNGYLFTSGPLIVPGRFQDAASLRVALAATPGLSAGFVFTTPTASTVLATATVPGLPGVPTASTSSPVLVSVGSTAGVAALFSQRRHQWGAYCEVWAGCGGDFGGTTFKGTATLAQRLTSDYRADNSYAFDVASALRQFTGHTAPVLGVCADRLVSYFVRFGEEYADEATGLRRVRSVYESEVCWGLEAMEVPAEVVPGLRLLTARPQPWRVQVGDRLPCGLLAEAAHATRRLLLRTRTATSRATADLLLATPIATGNVQVPGYLLPAANPLSGELLDSSTAAPTVAALLAALDFTAQGQALTFVNRQGSQDTVYFQGTSDPGSKRTASTYAGSAGPQALAAEVALPCKLTSGLLSYPEWDWLRRELGTSPAVWVAGTAVLVNDVVAEADAVKQEFTITVDYSPAPVRGLSN